MQRNVEYEFEIEHAMNILTVRGTKPFEEKDICELKLVIKCPGENKMAASPWCIVRTSSTRSFGSE